MSSGRKMRKPRLVHQRNLAGANSIRERKKKTNREGCACFFLFYILPPFFRTVRDRRPCTFDESHPWPIKRYLGLPGRVRSPQVRFRIKRIYLCRWPPLVRKSASVQDTFLALLLPLLV